MEWPAPSDGVPAVGQPSIVGIGRPSPEGQPRLAAVCCPPPALSYSLFLLMSHNLLLHPPDWQLDVAAAPARCRGRSAACRLTCSTSPAAFQQPHVAPLSPLFLISLFFLSSFRSAPLTHTTRPLSHRPESLHRILIPHHQIPLASAAARAAVAGLPALSHVLPLHLYSQPPLILRSVPLFPHSFPLPIRLHTVPLHMPVAAIGLNWPREREREGR